VLKKTAFNFANPYIVIHAFDPTLTYYLHVFSAGTEQGSDDERRTRTQKQPDAPQLGHLVRDHCGAFACSLDIRWFVRICEGHQLFIVPRQG
jgi:hypothetical protein